MCARQLEQSLNAMDLVTSVTRMGRLSDACAQADPMERSPGAWEPRWSTKSLWIIDLDQGADSELLRGLGTASKSVGQPRPCIVFLGSHPAQALTAYRLGGIHFLHKPIENEDLGLAVARAREHAWLERLRTSSEVLAAIVQERSWAEAPGMAPVVLSCRTESHRIDRRLVRFVEARNKRTLVETEKGPIEVHLPFSRVVEALGPTMFVRTHRSCLVSIERIVSLISTGQGAWFVSLDCGRRVPVSRVRVKELRARLAGESTGLEPRVPGAAPRARRKGRA